MRYILILFALVVTVLASDATLKIEKSTDSRPSVSIEDASIFGDKRTKKKIFNLIVGDLKVTSHFKVIDKYKEVSFNSSLSPLVESDYLFRYQIREDSLSRLLLDVKVYDNFNKDILYERSYRVSNRARYPFLIHRAVIDFNNFLELPSVDWMEKYVVFSQYSKPKSADIVVADYTLTYRKKVISGGLNIFPKWADREQRAIYYTKLEDRPQLYYYDIYTGEESRVLSSDGMLICSDVSRDGKKLLLTMAPNGQPDIYLYDISTGKSTRVTTYAGIDVSAQFLGGERDIVFVSDRMGYPNIFKKTIGERAVEQLVYHGKNNNACSAHGKYVVYTSRENDNEFSSNTFNLYLVSTQSDYIRRLTASGINQFPKFSSDGKNIMYIKHYASQSALGVIRLDYNEGFLFPLKGHRIQSIDW